MANYNVVNHDGGWAVKKDGAGRSSSVHSTQGDAYNSARGYASNSGGGELRVQGRDGRFRESNTIGKPDPFPPAG